MGRIRNNRKRRESLAQVIEDLDKNGPLHPILQTRCWIWQGCINSIGYGQITIAGQIYLAHRFVYEYLVGLIPEGLTLDHLCRNTACVNPDHLEPVTYKENTLRGIGPTAINSKKTYCKHGHEFTVENTRMRKSGGRSCRTCERRTSLQRIYNIKGIKKEATGERIYNWHRRSRDYPRNKSCES